MPALRSAMAPMSLACTRFGEPPTPIRCASLGSRRWARHHMGQFAYRVLGAALLDRSVYEGIEADRNALPQALATVLIASLAAGFGAAGWRGPQPTTVALAAGLSLLTWFVWASLMFQIGGRVMPARETDTNLGELLRTTGFAAAPGWLQVAAILPGMTVPVFVVTWIWMFAATVVAVRQALDYRSLPRTFAVCAVAAVVSVTLALAIGLAIGPTVE